MRMRAESVAVRVSNEQDQGFRRHRVHLARASSILSSAWPAGNNSDFLGEGGDFVGGINVSDAN